MKRKVKNTKKICETNVAVNSEPSIFHQLMDLRSELHATCGFEPVPFWERPEELPNWTKNICVKLRDTILKSVRKLRPKRNKVDWRKYGRCIGILERYKTFLASDIQQILKEDGLDKLSQKQWDKIQPHFGEEEARQYYLKILGRPVDDQTSFEELLGIILEKEFTYFENQKQIAFSFLVGQSAKINAIFLKGMSEGFTIFLNEDGQFSGDDRRAGIHFELLAWLYDIEKMRKMVPQKTRNHLFNQIKQIPEFKNRTQDWFNDVCKKVELSLGQRGRPWKFKQAQF